MAESLLPNRLSDDDVELVILLGFAELPDTRFPVALMEAIGQRARQGALLHTLIHYADHDMKEQPACLVPTENGDLIDKSPSGSTITAPLYSPEDLNRGMGRFVIERVRLLSNGMQEFLFRLE